MPTRYFRAGVGTVIYNQSNEVAFFKRFKNPIGIWQFQQGGIDLGESPEETLWRELKEEAGLEAKHILNITTVPGWINYQDLNSFDDHSVPRLGQIHRWFFLELDPSYAIDLTTATDDEFSDFKWTNFEDVIKSTSSHKKHVYEQLFGYFKELRGIE